MNEWIGLMYDREKGLKLNVKNVCNLMCVKVRNKYIYIFYLKRFILMYNNLV